MNLIYWSVCSSGKEMGKGLDEGIVILASCKHHFIRVYDNLVQLPSNNISFILKPIFTPTLLPTPSSLTVQCGT